MKITLQEILDKLRDIEGSCSNAYNTTPDYQANSDGKYYMNEAQDLNKKTKGYQFLANINTSVIFNWNIKDLIKK